MSLIDGNLNVIRANAEFTFKGTTANTDGTTSKVTLTGTLFLVPDGNDWKIEAFNINREENPTRHPRPPRRRRRPRHDQETLGGRPRAVRMDRRHGRRHDRQRHRRAGFAAVRAPAAHTPTTPRHSTATRRSSSCCWARTPGPASRR